MSDKSAIEWTDASWNPIRGTAGRHTCARLSPGCDHCYAATMNHRGLGGTQSLDYGLGETLIDPARLDEKALLQPLRWKTPRRIFVGSMTDVGGAWVPDAWLDAIWAVMALAPQHTFQVLTKRPARLWKWFQSDPYERVIAFANHTIRSWRPALIGIGISNPATFPYRHVHIGVSVELDRYVWRANILREIPAEVRWVSAEPLLSGLPSLDLTGISWVVAGGESGPGARPMHPDWTRDLRDRCRAAGVAYFFKQWGEHAPVRPYDDTEGWHPGEIVLNRDGRDWRGSEILFEDGAYVMRRVGKKAAGRLLDGVEWSQFPESRVAVAGGAR